MKMKNKLGGICITIILLISAPSVLVYATEMGNTQANSVGLMLDNSNDSSYVVQEGCKVSFELGNAWETGHNMTITVTNTYDKEIRNWEMELCYSKEITSIWNAVIVEEREGCYLIRNDEWNKDIPVGGSISFGIGCEGPFSSFPQEYRVLDNDTIKRNDENDVEVLIKENWNTGCTGEITIWNHSDAVIKDWILEFDCSCNLQSLWEGKIISQEGNHYVVKNVGYNHKINPGETVTLGFWAEGDYYNGLLNNCKVYEYAGEDDVIDETPETSEESDENIGDAYCKEVSKEDIIYDEETGISYAKNQLLVSVYQGVPKEIVEAVAAEMDAEIVGYIALTNDYQFEFNREKTLSELEVLTDFMNGFSFVCDCSLNLCVERVLDGNEVPWEDELYKDGIIAWNKNQYTAYYNNPVTNEKEAGLSYPGGDNWGLKVLHIPEAWEKIENTNAVKVGIYDHGFSKDVHEDLKSIVKQYNNGAIVNNGDHGTHIAGIIGAEHNNVGIAGVSTNAKLYTYSFTNSYYSVMGDKVAFATLIGNQVKVINYSQGLNYQLSYAASNVNARTNAKVIEEINNIASSMSKFLGKLLKMGYDFTIVSSSGNANNKKFIEKSTAEGGIYGYVVDNAGTKECDIEALYNSPINAINDPLVKDRIIVVGSIGCTRKNANDVEYYLAAANNVGGRVDVYAPGEDILSTVSVNFTETDIPGYRLMSGSSMAVPHVAGIVALMYQANPTIGATEVKRIVCDSGSLLIANTQNGTNVAVPNAEVCVSEALNAQKQVTQLNNGLILGRVVDADKEEGIEGLKVKVFRNEENPNASGREVVWGTTDEDGMIICSVPAGVYMMQIEHQGYMPYVIYNICVEANAECYLEKIKLPKLSVSDISIMNFSGRVINNTTAAVVSDAYIRFRKGWNNRTDAYIKDRNGQVISAKTESNGVFNVAIYKGAYTAEIVKDGYVTGYFNINVPAGKTENNICAISPLLSEDEYRIVLTWGRKPMDLDSHLTYYEDGTRQFHIYYGNRTVCYNSNEVAMLDLDDTDGYGPETVTIFIDEGLVESGRFSYSVRDYTNAGKQLSLEMSDSCAKVSLYKGNSLLEIYNVPVNKEGTVWHVFDLDKDGITVLNEYGNTIP